MTAKAKPRTPVAPQLRTAHMWATPGAWTAEDVAPGTPLEAFADHPGGLVRSPSGLVAVTARHADADFLAHWRTHFDEIIKLLGEAVCPNCGARWYSGVDETRACEWCAMRDELAINPPAPEETP